MEEGLVRGGSQSFKSGKSFATLCTLGIALALLTLPLLPVSQPVLAQTEPCRVRLNTAPTVYETVQAAIDAANDGDVVKISGTCAGVQTRAVQYRRAPETSSQVALVDGKEITLQGGYTATFDEPPDPQANPTTLDAQGAGRGILVVNGSAATIAGLRITGGNAVGQRGGPDLGGPTDGGGGILVLDSWVNISNNEIFGNTSRDDTTPMQVGGAGGVGVFSSGTASEVRDNIIRGNTSRGFGGGLTVLGGNPIVEGNIITNNDAGTGPVSVGGGISIAFTARARFVNNVVANNGAAKGSGIFVIGSSPDQVYHNTIAYNNGGDGRGIYVTNQVSLGGQTIRFSPSAITLVNNLVFGHTSESLFVDRDPQNDINVAVSRGTFWGNTPTDWRTDGPAESLVLNGNVFGNPAFFEPVENNFRLRAESDAIDQGVLIGIEDSLRDIQVPTDITGIARPQGDAPDVGAYESPDTPNPPPQPNFDITLTAQSGDTSIELRWEVPNNHRVRDYRIQRGTNADANLTTIGTTNRTFFLDEDTALLDGVLYCYQVAALDAADEVIATSNVACASVGQLELFVPDVWGEPGDTVIVPINIRNANGLRIGASDFWLDVDPEVLSRVDVQTTALTAGRYAFRFGNNAETDPPGRVRVSAIPTDADDILELHGEGSLFWVYFRVNGTAGDTSPLNLREYIFGLGGSTIYRADNLQTPLPTFLRNGLFTVGADRPLGDLNGDGVINAADAAIALRIASGDQEATDELVSVGDVNGDGVINPADASLLLFYAANGRFPNENELILSANAGLAQAETPVTLTLSEVQGTAGSVVSVQLEAENLTTWAGGELVLVYDTDAIARITNVSAATLVNDFDLEFEDDGNGILTVAMADEVEHTANGILFTVEVALAANVVPGSTPLYLAEAVLNDGAGRDFATSLLQRQITLHTETSTPPLLRGDANGDNTVDAGDLSALVLRVFENRFLDQPGGADANGDGSVDAGDISCLVLILFDQSCAPQANLTQNQVPALSLPENLTPESGDTVQVPVRYTSNESSISSLVFALEYDQTRLRFDPTDSDNDGIPDAVTINVPASFQASMPVIEAGKLGFVIADFAPPLAALSDDTLVTVTMESLDPTAGPLNRAIGFAAAPPVSFGDTEGRSVQGTFNPAFTSTTVHKTYLPFLSYRGQ